MARAFLCIKGLGYQEARLANICSCVAGAHCDEVDENPEASRQQAVAHQYRVRIPRTTGSRHNKIVEWGSARRPCLCWGPGFLHAAEVRMSDATWMQSVMPQVVNPDGRSGNIPLEASRDDPPPMANESSMLSRGESTKLARPLLHQVK